MRIAVPIENGEVFQHFGHAERFRFYDVMDDGEKNFVEASTEGTGHAAVSAWLQTQGVQMVLCGGIGPDATDALRDAGILLCSGAQGEADACIDAFLRYAEEYQNGPTCSGHDGGSCGGGCEGGCGSCGGGCGGCGGCHSEPERSDYKESRTFTEITMLTKQNFQAEVVEDPGLIFIDFYADWCGPCKMMSPIFEELNKEEPLVKFCRINVDEQQEIAGMFGIQSVPTFVLVQNCRTITGFVGACEKEALTVMIDRYRPEAAE